MNSFKIQINLHAIQFYGSRIRFQIPRSQFCIKHFVGKIFQEEVSNIFLKKTFWKCHLICFSQEQLYLWIIKNKTMKDPFFFLVISLVVYHNLKPPLHLRCKSKLQAKIYCLLIRNNCFDEILNIFLWIDISSYILVMFK